MQNAKDELVSAINNSKSKIQCGYVCFDDGSFEFKKSNYIKLPLNFSKEDYNEFLSKIDIDYDSGFGSQELEGIIWLADNSWLERYEYDGSECWVHKELPKIPQYLL